MKKLAVANGQYQNSQGETKTRWVNIGIINTTQAGKEYMLLDPTINLAGFQREDGKDMIMVGIFEEQNNNNGNGQQSYNNQQQNNNGNQAYQPPQQQYQPPAQPQVQHENIPQGNYDPNTDVHVNQGELELPF